MPVPRFDIKHTAMLVVDMQEKLVPHMHNAEAVVAAAGKLIDTVNILGVPVLVTEQYRKGLGVTVAALAGRLKSALCNQEKLEFSACIEPIRSQLAESAIRSVIVCGLEAHVCVLQTCLDLADAGYITGVVVDAIASRRLSDQQAAVDRMRQEGVLVTTVESVILELVGGAGDAGGDRFKRILPIIR